MHFISGCQTIFCLGCMAVTASSALAQSSPSSVPSANQNSLIAGGGDATDWAYLQEILARISAENAPAYLNVIAVRPADADASAGGSSAPLSYDQALVIAQSAIGGANAFQPPVATSAVASPAYPLGFSAPLPIYCSDASTAFGSYNLQLPRATANNLRSSIQNLGTAVLNDRTTLASSVTLPMPPNSLSFTSNVTNRTSLSSYGSFIAPKAAAPITLAASNHPAVPSLSSNPGAPYTIYLDFAGFSFSGTWGGSSSSSTPGVTPAFDNATTAFTAADLTNIRQMWARTAEKYSPFGVNVTTVDPAAAGASDSARQAFYDQAAQLMHTVIGGTGSWSGGGGVSYVGVASTSTYSWDPTSNNGAGPGYHTNFVFSTTMGNDPHVIAEDASHENGHGLGLSHQSDYSVSPFNEYSSNGGVTGPGSVAPIMGASYYAQRGVWRSGDSDQGGSGPTPQNDPQVIFANANMTVTNDGNGHTQVTATPLPLSGGSINYNLAKGVIVPADTANPNPIDPSSYTTDLFSFLSAGGPMNVTLYNSAERLTPGSPDPGGTLSSTLTLLDGGGNQVTQVSTNFSASSPNENITQTLPPGLFYLQVASTGGQTSTTESSAQYYDMGDYFLTGYVPAPEPTSLLMTGLAVSALLIRRRRAA